MCHISPRPKILYIIYLHTNTISTFLFIDAGNFEWACQALGPSNLWNARWTIEGKHGQGWVARCCLLDIFDMLARPETTETLVTSLTCLVFFFWWNIYYDFHWFTLDKNHPIWWNRFSWFKCIDYSPKIHMELKNGGLEDVFPFPRCYFQVPY